MVDNKLIFIVIATSLAIAAAWSAPSGASAAANSDGFSDGKHRGGTGRLLAGGNHISPRAQLTCDVYPRVCRAAGSPGPDCCGKDCVDVTRDEANCGQCGLRCAYGETCCGGSCVNVRFDPRNCGWCRNRCKRGGECQYGMCDYA